MGQTRAPLEFGHVEPDFVPEPRRPIADGASRHHHVERASVTDAAGSTGRARTVIASSLHDARSARPLKRWSERSLQGATRRRPRRSRRKAVQRAASAGLQGAAHGLIVTGLSLPEADANLFVVFAIARSRPKPCKSPSSSLSAPRHDRITLPPIVGFEKNGFAACSYRL